MPAGMILIESCVTQTRIWVNLGRQGVLIALMGLAYWLNIGSPAVRELLMLAEHGFTCYGTRQVLTQ